MATEPTTSAAAPPSIFGGVPRQTTYRDVPAPGFHGTGTSTYPSVPQTWAVLSACVPIEQVNVAATPPGNVSVPTTPSSTPVGCIRATA